MSNTLMTIPLSQLKRSKTNVRKTDISADIEQLAASIEANGILENLIVRRIENLDGADPQIYEVTAGGRRLAALKLLVKHRKISFDYPVPCLVLEKHSAAQAIETSLAENIVRAPLHPADQFDAFLKLQKEGLPAEDIAARFGISATVVSQRLKLATVSPRLIAEYRSGEMTLEQLMAFTISDDRNAQEEVWFENALGDFSPQAIRRHLTKSHVDGQDRRARFIGAKAYEEAGGIVVRDLFQPEGEGYFADSQLLDRLVAEKLGREAEAIKSEGWGWLAVMPETDYNHLTRFGRIKPNEIMLSEAEEEQISVLSDRYDELISAIEENDSDDSTGELDRVTAELDMLRAKKEVWPEEEKKSAGVVISLDSDGAVTIVRGLLKPDEQKPAGTGSDHDRRNGTREKNTNGYSDSLLVELSAHRTAALREMLASQVEQAMIALLHALLLRVFFADHSGSCIEMTPTILDLRKVSQTVGESKAAIALVARHNAWVEQLPEREELWAWLSGLSADDRLDLLAYCVALTVDGLHRPGGSPERQTPTILLAQALGLDMADWWRPTQAGFFDRLTKGQILAAVAEGVSREAAHPLVDRKKSLISHRAAELLAPTRWLPKPLRTPEPGEDGVTISAAAE